MLIKINDEFALEPYTHGWRLHHYVPTTNRKGKEIIADRVTYYGRLEAACKRIVEFSTRDASVAEEILATMENVHSDIASAINRLPIDLRNAVKYFQ